jgi:hypothetical protein
MRVERRDTKLQLHGVPLPCYPALVIYLICNKTKITNKFAGFAQGYNKKID